MGHLKTVRVHRHGEDVDFQYKVSVNADGLFTTTLPADIASRLVDAGIELEENRNKVKGFVWAQTLERLREKIKEILDEYLSRELTESIMVIRYAIETACSYCVDVDSTIVPNGCFLSDYTPGEGCEWSGGSITQDPIHRHAYGILVYAVPQQKETFKYKSGKIRIEYGPVELGWGLNAEKPHLSRLNSFNHMTPPTQNSKVQDITYTEDVARFFADLVTSICAMNEQIQDKLSPEHITRIAESGQKLIPDQTSNRENADTKEV